MKNVVKFVFLAVLVPLTPSAKPATLNGQPLEPRDTLNDQGISNPVISWFVNRWRELGYAVPEEGKPFKWSDYLESVPDNKGQAGDMVRWIEGGTPMMGIVAEPAGVPPDPGMKLNEEQTRHYMATLAVIYPTGPAMSMTAPVDEKDVVGYLRPHKADAKASPSPSPIEYKEGEI